jgi:type I restriction-modification system DNA methylase subunit
MSSPQPSTATNSGLNPEEFTKEYLGTQTLDRLKLIKKQCGFRKKTETHSEFVEAIHEWYQKNHVPKSDNQTPKTRKHRAKKEVIAATVAVVHPKKKSIEFNKDYLNSRTLEQLKATQAKYQIPGDTENQQELAEIIYNWGETKYAAAENQPMSVEESIRAEVQEDANGGSHVPQSATKEKKPRQTKKKAEQAELKPITLQRPTKRVLAKLTDAEREDIRKNKEAKQKIYQFLDNIHDQLRGSSVAGEAAMDDIIMFIILAKLDVMIANGLFNIWDTRTQAEGGEFDNTCAIEILELVDYMKAQQGGLIYLLCHKSDQPLRNNNPDQPDLVRQIGMLLKAHPFSKPFIRDVNLFHLDNEHTLRRILFKFDTITHAKGRAARAAKEAAENPSPSGATPSSATASSPNPETRSKPSKKTAKQAKNTELEEIDLEALNQMDAIGTIYEYFTNKYKGNQGKDMGQYFTERDLMLMSLHLIDKSDLEELGITSDSTMGDEFCGAFGFPLKTREYFDKAFGIEFRPENVYGVEYSAKTFALAAANAMLSTNTAGKFKLTHGSSFNTNLEPHLDISVHNVPFGDTMRWSDIIKYAEPFAGHQDILNKEITEKQNVDAVLSAQLVIYKTRKLGILIIKDGKETSSPAFEAFRRSIMDKCCVRKIMKIPGTAFTHTNTKTICIYFTKPVDGRKTGSIQFCQLSDGLDEITEICQVPREDLEARFCSWNPQDYLIDEHAETMKGKSVCSWRKLGEVVSFKSGNMLSRKDCVNGEYPVIGGGQTPSCYHNSYNMEANTILCSKSGEYAGFISKYNTPVWASDCFGIIPKAELNNNYLHYWLKHIQEHIYIKQTGGGQPHINERDIKYMEIPVPSLEIQQQMVARMVQIEASKELIRAEIKKLDDMMKDTLEQSYTSTDSFQDIRMPINHSTEEPVNPAAELVSSSDEETETEAESDTDDE